MPPVRKTILVLGAWIGLTCGYQEEDSREPDEWLGRDHASSLTLTRDPGPIEDTDLTRASERGRQIFWMNHIYTLGHQRGLPRVGANSAMQLLPIAMVDDGLHSGQVTFYRWDEADFDKQGNPRPERARRWLVVPILLRPDRVLELEQFSDRVEENDEVHRTIAAVFAARSAAGKEHPGHAWRSFPYRESGGKRPGQRRTRVYMLAESGPDLEVFVADGRGRSPADIEQIRVVHASIGAPLHTELSAPSPLTVARALAKLQPGDTVKVTTASGADFRIDDHGEISTSGAKP